MWVQLKFVEKYLKAQLRVCYHEFYEFTNLTNLRVDNNFIEFY